MAVYWVRRTHTKRGHNVEFYFKRDHGVTTTISHQAFENAINGRNTSDPLAMNVSAQMRPVHHAHVLTSYDKNGKSETSYWTSVPEKQAQSLLGSHVSSYQFVPRRIKNSSEFFGQVYDHPESLSHAMTLADMEYARKLNIVDGHQFFHAPTMTIGTVVPVIPVSKHLIIPVSSKLVRGKCFTMDELTKANKLEKYTIGERTSPTDDTIVENGKQGITYNSCIEGQQDKCDFSLTIFTSTAADLANESKKREKLVEKLINCNAMLKWVDRPWTCTDTHQQYFVFPLPKKTLAERLASSPPLEKDKLKLKLSNLYHKIQTQMIAFNGHIWTKDIIVKEKGNTEYDLYIYNFAAAQDYSGSGLTLAATTTDYMSANVADGARFIAIGDNVP